MTKIEFSSLTDIKNYQEKQLIEQLNYLQLHSPFYKELFASHKIDLNSIKKIEDLVAIPTTSKEVFNEQNFDFLCVEKGKIVDYTTTSGTTGKPVTVALTENDLQRLAQNEQQSFETAGAKSTDVFQLMLTLDRQFMAGMAYYLGLRKIGAGIVRVGSVSPAMQWDNILRFQPNAIVAVPSFILKLIEYAEANNISLQNSSIEKAICIGEPLRNADLTPNILTKRILDKWKIQLHSTYASTEMQTAFTECEHENGGHLQPDLLLLEILDEDGNQLKAGEFGEVTITSLGVEAMPLLRYRTGDIACYFQEPCTCGRNSIRISPIVGRKNQMIKYKGTTIYPPAIYDALSQVSEIKDYLVEISKNEIETDEILIYIAQNGDVDVVERKIKNALQSKLRVIPALDFVSSQQLNAMRPSDTRKPTSIIFKAAHHE